MTERNQRDGGPSLAIMSGVAWCTFCGKPDGRPIQGIAEISVCEQCLCTACREILEDLDQFDRL